MKSAKNKQKKHRVSRSILEAEPFFNSSRHPKTAALIICMLKKQWEAFSHTS